MALDPNIALGVRPLEVSNPLAQYAQIAQLKNFQNQDALAQYQLGAAQRTEARDVARMNALAQAGTDETAIGNALLKSGDIKGYSDFIKANREGQKALIDMQDIKLKQSRSFLDTLDLNNPNAPAQYIAWHEANHRDPILGPMLAARGVTAEQARAGIDAAIARGPQAFADLVNQSKLGVDRFMDLNKPTTQVVDQSGQRVVLQTPGLGGAPKAVGTYVDVPLPKDVEEQKKRITREGRAPATPSAPVAVVDESGKTRYVSREEAISKGMTPANAFEGITPKEIQKREAALPQAKSSVTSFETKTDQFIKELIALRDDVGLDQITGPIYGRTPSVSREGSRAQALYNKIFAKGGFQGLQDLREASKTGGALGNVSNEEGRRLEASVVGGLDRTQNIEDVKAGINDLIDSLNVSKARVRNTFDETYQYKSGRGAAAPAAPAANVVTNPQFPGFSVGKP